MGASVAGLAFKLSGSNFVLTFALSAVPAFLALLLVTAVRSANRIMAFPYIWCLLLLSCQSLR